MKSMKARENIELFLENAGEAEVAHLTRVDRYMFVPLLTLLLSQNFSIL